MRPSSSISFSHAALTLSSPLRSTKNVFLPAEPSWNGRFMDYEGNAMPW